MLLKILGVICLILSLIFLIGSFRIRNHDINCPYERHIGLALSFAFLCAAVSLLGFVDSNTNKKGLDVELLTINDGFLKCNTQALEEDINYYMESSSGFNCEKEKKC